MGRRRKIENEKLPPYVYLSKGRYIWRPYKEGKLGREHRLCDGSATLSEIWSAYEAVICQERDTLRWLLIAYMKSDQYKSLSPKTRQEQERQKETICLCEMKNGRTFGEIPVKKITPGIIRKYLDNRGESAPILANREVALISSAFSWGRERDLVIQNPCKGVRRNKEKARTRYVTDYEYHLVYELAKKTAPLYVFISMEIAYLCRARREEVLKLKENDIKDDGLFIDRLKKSRSQIISWTSRLQAAVELARELPGISWKRYLLHRQDGQRINNSTFDSAWQRLMKRALQAGLKERFTFHDLKAKGVSDFEGDKKLASGHKSDAMVDVYDRKPKLVKATR